MSGIVSQAQGNNATEQLAAQSEDELAAGNLCPRLYPQLAFRKQLQLSRRGHSTQRGFERLHSS